EVQIVTRVGNIYKVVATSPIHDINKVLEHPLPESTEYDTLSGLLVMHKPFDLKEGDELELFSYRIKILKITRSLPELVEMQYVEPPEQYKNWYRPLIRLSSQQAIVSPLRMSRNRLTFRCSLLGFRLARMIQVERNGCSDEY